MAFSFKPDDNYNVSETGNWNVASDYAKLKIMKPLYLADIYEEIAREGTSTLMEELQIPSDYSVDQLKIKGFGRLVSCLILTTRNTLFAMRKEKEKMKTIQQELIRIQKITPSLSKKIKNQRKGTTEIKIIFERYDPILERVSELKEEILFPLNQNDLIFITKEEFDPIAYKKQVMEQASTRG